MAVVSLSQAFTKLRAHLVWSLQCWNNLLSIEYQTTLLQCLIYGMCTVLVSVMQIFPMYGLRKSWSCKNIYKFSGFRGDWKLSNISVCSMQDDLSRSVLSLQTEKLELEKQVQMHFLFYFLLPYIFPSALHL